MSYDLKTIFPAVSMIGVLAVAPVAPEAGNVLFLGSAILSMLLVRPLASGSGRQPTVWMPLVALSMIGLAYVLSAGLQGLTGLLFFSPMLAVWPLVSLLRRWNRTDFQLVVGVVALCGAIGAGTMAIFEVQTTGTPRAGNFVANPIHFADAALLAGFCAMVGFGAVASWGRYVFVLGPVMGAVAALLSGTRGALAALAVMIVAGFLVAAALRLIGRTRLIALAAGLSGVVMLGLALGGEQISVVQRVLTDMTDLAAAGSLNDPSAALRFQMYLGGWRAFVESPLVGHGPLGFTAVADSLADVPFGGAPHLHSDLVDVAASAGLLGLGGYILILSAPLVAAARSRLTSSKPWTMVLAWTLVSGFFTMGLTNAMVGILTLTNMLAAIIVIVGVLSSEPDHV